MFHNRHGFKTQLSRLNIIYTKLKKVIDNCALTQDLQVLPGGQFTEIGEKGISLSGFTIVLQ